MADAPNGSAELRVLRIFHAGVVGGWRARDRALRAKGADLELVTAERWDEGGAVVQLEPDGDEFVLPARTFGSHPNAFLYDPRPIWRAMRRHRPDMVDVCEEPCSLATAEVLLLRRLACPGARVVLYSAQNIFKRFPWPFRAFERSALRVAGGLYVCNQEAARILQRKGFEGTIAVLPLGIDLARFSPPPAGGLERADEDLHIGYIGRLERRKGLHVVLEAMRQEPTWSLDVVGDGPDADELRLESKKAGIEQRVRFAGFAANAELPDLYRSFDVVVVPSLPTPTWEEQFCRVAVEAMASGVPVVASASGALPEVVGPGGRLFPPGDHQALRQILGELSRDQAARLELAGRALEWARAFSWEVVADRHAELYRTVLQAVPHRAPVRSVMGDGTAPEPALGRPVSVIVVAYGHVDDLERCLRGLDGRYPVTVVDNAGEADCARAVEAHGASYIRSPRNLGFAAAVNQALGDPIAAGHHVLLLNPDAVIAGDEVARLAAFLDAPGNERVAATAPRQHGSDPADEQRVAWPFPSPAGTWADALGMGRLLRRQSFLVGSVLLLRNEALADVGGFDERFFLYAEETDWQWRAHLRGWTVRLHEGVVAHHLGAGTSDDAALREALFHCSAELLLRKWHGRAGWTAARAATIVGALARAASRRGDERRRALARARLYVRGPQRVAASMDRW